jgi:hypothetical protein
MAFATTKNLGTTRLLGSQEAFCRNCNKKDGSLNLLCGLTLVTRHSIDEGKKVGGRKWLDTAIRK